MTDNFDCVDCGVDTLYEYYMIHDDLWNRVAGMQMQPDGMLCVGCLEARIGRRLVQHDFKDVPINWLWPHSERLTARLLGVQVHQVHHQGRLWDEAVV